VKRTTFLPERLAVGGLVDRTVSVRFTFDGKAYSGHPGDTLASALVANGVRLVGRSFKYHRPRGLLAAGPEEPNGLVELGHGALREPNTRATMVELREGIEAHSQNRWPSLALDVMSINQLAAPMLGAGFYYKTFMWPASFWEKVYEPLIRRAAGLGRPPTGPDPDRYEKATIHCDVLVIGAGAAGLMAALAAGRAGARVILAEEDFRLGGRLLSETRPVGGRDGHAWADEVEAELASLSNVTILKRTSVFGVYDHGTYGAVEQVAHDAGTHAPRQRLWRIVARRSVLTAGALERPLVFGGNDRPGVMLAGAVRSYVNRYAARPGHRVVVFGNNHDMLRTLGDLSRAGIGVAALVDPRPETTPDVQAAADAAGAQLFAGSVVCCTFGGRQVHAVEIRGPKGATIMDCDILAMSGGWTPTLHLTSHLGGKPVHEPAIGAFVPGSLPPGMAVAGAATGLFGLDECLTSGAAAGLSAASDAGFEGASVEIPDVARERVELSPLWLVPGSRGKAFIDFQNDVTASDVATAEREAFRSVEHLKRYTTLGMATDQGRTSNVNGLAVMAGLRGIDLGKAGTTTFRPPFTPVAVGALAGHHKGKAFRPTRLTAAHGWAAEQGASFVEAGAWLRAQWFNRPGDADWLASCAREVEAVRGGVGICDVSTLGKIDIQGPDAAELLERLYVNGFRQLPVARARYGVMLREDGFVFDDGTTTRLGETHYLMTTTTANAGKVMAHIEHALQVLWPDLDAHAVSVTEQWTQFAVAGPSSRALLQRIVDSGHDLSNAAFPFMAAAEMTILGGVRARLFRISFSGELAYELGVPARCGDALGRALMAAGQDLGVTPYGLEAMSVMRIEKGHAAGGELNGQTTAADLGLGRMMSTRKDYVGRVMATRPALVAPDRPALVGFKTVDPADVVSGGAHVLDRGAAATVENDLGHVTSVAWSPLFKRWIGLALVKSGPSRIGEIVRAWDAVRKRDVPVELCPPVFYDPEGERLRA
jgi:methylglutamate dehydrogenase subunit C